MRNRSTELWKNKANLSEKNDSIWKTVIQWMMAAKKLNTIVIYISNNYSNRIVTVETKDSLKKGGLLLNKSFRKNKFKKLLIVSTILINV